jgi:hypothetical protein
MVMLVTNSTYSWITLTLCSQIVCLLVIQGARPSSCMFGRGFGHAAARVVGGRCLFYYFAEAQQDATKLLTLWLNGGSLLLLTPRPWREHAQSSKLADFIVSCGTIGRLGYGRSSMAAPVLPSWSSTRLALGDLSDNTIWSRDPSRLGYK